MHLRKRTTSLGVVHIRRFSPFASFPQLTVSPAILRTISLRLEATAISLQDCFLLEVADRPSSHHLPLLVTACSYTLSLPRLNIAFLPRHGFLLQVLGPFSPTPLCPPLHDLRTPLVAPSSNQLLPSPYRITAPTFSTKIPCHVDFLVTSTPKWNPRQPNETLKYAVDHLK